MNPKQILLALPAALLAMQANALPLTILTPVVLSSDQTFTFDSVTFGSTVDSDATARSLTVNTSAGGLTRFDGALGSTAALASVTTNADGQTDINGGTVTTTGDQTYNDFLTFSDDLTLTTGSRSPKGIMEADIFLHGGAAMDLGGTTEPSYEQIFATGDVFVNGTVNLALIGGFAPSVGDIFDLISATTITDLGLTLSAPALPGGAFFDFAIVSAADHGIFRASVRSAVPEPSSLALMGMGFAILGLRRYIARS